MQAHKHLAFSFCIFFHRLELWTLVPGRDAVRAQVRGPLLRALRAGATASPTGSSKKKKKTKPPGACPRRPEPGVLSPYVQRLRNSSLDTAVTKSAARPLPGAGAPSSAAEADPGAPCCPMRLSDQSVKEPSALQFSLRCWAHSLCAPPLVFQLQPGILEI